uniref:Uncharacterized protein n=1 Tax=Arundo donax TaxID=35708 RepID=A0A0A9AGE9_ARUDO
MQKLELQLVFRVLCIQIAQGDPEVTEDGHSNLPAYRLRRMRAR